MADVINPQVLRALREARGWDQQTFATTAAVDPSVVSRLERGLQHNLKASVLVALAHALETPVDTLLAGAHQRATPAFVAELTAILSRVSTLAPAHQRQLAAIVQAYLATMPE
jgi:transcriptional regulator with XRE-family HTH domain